MGNTTNHLQNRISYLMLTFPWATGLYVHAGPLAQTRGTKSALPVFMSLHDKTPGDCAWCVQSVHHVCKQHSKQCTGCGRLCMLYTL